MLFMGSQMAGEVSLNKLSYDTDALRNASFPPTPPWRRVATGSWGTSPFNSLASEHLFPQGRERGGNTCEEHRAGTDHAGKVPKRVGDPLVSLHWLALNSTDQYSVHKAPLKTYQFPI